MSLLVRRISASSVLPLPPAKAAPCVLDLLDQEAPQSHLAAKSSLYTDSGDGVLAHLLPRSRAQDPGLGLDVARLLGGQAARRTGGGDRRGRRRLQAPPAAEAAQRAAAPRAARGRSRPAGAGLPARRAHPRRQAGCAARFRSRRIS